MGCFLSSTKKTPPNSNTKLQATTIHRSPPLTLAILEQEEEVKEILSETPIIINNNPIIHTADEKNNIPKKNVSHNIHDSHVFKIAKIFNPRELTGSIRVGSGPNETAKELSKNIQVGSDQKETVKDLSMHIRVGSGQETKEELRRNNRVGSHPKETMIKVVRQKSPARKSGHHSGSGQIRNTSPAKKPDHQSGSGQTRNISPGRKTGGLTRKENGESSCRRSRSPVMCGDQINRGTRNSISRCPSTRKSPGRVRSELGDRRRSAAPEAGNGNRSNRENNNNYKRSLTSGTHESIENPLVSLECFIFI